VPRSAGQQIRSRGAAKAIAKEGITVLHNGFRDLSGGLLEYKTAAGLKRFDRGSLRLIAVAGAPLDLDLKSRRRARVRSAAFERYGITECSPGISAVPFDAPRPIKPSEPLLPGVEARIRTIDAYRWRERNRRASRPRAQRHARLLSGA